MKAYTGTTKIAGIFTSKLVAAHLPVVKSTLTLWKSVNVLWRLFLALPWVGLRCVIVVFPDHTHLLFENHQDPDQVGPIGAAFDQCSNCKDNLLKIIKHMQQTDFQFMNFQFLVLKVLIWFMCISFDHKWWNQSVFSTIYLSVIHIKCRLFCRRLKCFRSILTNSEEPDRTAPTGAVRSGSHCLLRYLNKSIIRANICSRRLASWQLTSWLSFVMSHCEVVTFPLVSWVRCDAWLYRFLIFALLLTLSSRRNVRCFYFYWH